MKCFEFSHDYGLLSFFGGDKIKKSELLIDTKHNHDIMCHWGCKVSYKINNKCIKYCTEKKTRFIS